MSTFLEQFGSDATLENDGVWVPFDGFRVKLAANSPNNIELQAAMNESIEWARNEFNVQNINNLPPKQNIQFSAKLYAKGYVRDWQTEVEGKFKKGIDLGGKTLAKVTPENIEKALIQAHRFIQVLTIKSASIKMYQNEKWEADVKNS